MPVRVLIVTAAFGEGHNSAARNLELAFAENGVETLVADPCMLGIPKTTGTICKAYRLVTTYSPKLWHQIYETTGKVDFSRQRMPLMRRPEAQMAGLIDRFKPDAIVSTYPLYPYFADRILAKTGQSTPVYTVVTDSIEINSAWIDAPRTKWLVTDEFTRRSMIQAGLDQASVIETGFAVHPEFSRLHPVSPDAEVDPFNVLYFATPKLPHVRRISKAVLNASPKTRITIVLGKNLRLLYSRAKEIKERFPDRVKIKGWTRKVPQLFAKHHLVIGKAGGATVHEAIAACCPMLVHHLVPGQEEGNLALLKRIGGGTLASTPDAIHAQTTEMLADHARGWRRMKSALAKHGRNAGSLTIARYIMEDLKQGA